MNLKEAFRYQNKLLALMTEAQEILSWDKNVTKIEKTVLLHKVNPEAQDETTLETPETEYADQINQVAAFLVSLLGQRETLCYAIRRAKQSMDIDFDGEVGLNAKRQELAALYRRMAQLRSTEVLIPNGGTGYKFNAEGNQVAYRCDLKQVTTINFDRNKIRAYAAELSRQADQISSELDRRMVNTQVDYTPSFDVNESFAEVFQRFTEENS